MYNVQTKPKTLNLCQPQIWFDDQKSDLNICMVYNECKYTILFKYLYVQTLLYQTNANVYICAKIKLLNNNAKVFISHTYMKFVMCHRLELNGIWEKQIFKHIILETESTNKTTK